jgi:MYXO-CTERM domain-containing protein
VEAATLSGGLNSGINDLAFNLANDELLVATANGLLHGSATPGAQSVALTPTGGLSRTQCVDVFGAQTYACSWNYDPDNAAIAVGANGAATLSSLFRFDQTRGPISCAAGTTVGDQCGVIWSSYATELGINGSSPDGGVGDGGEMMPGGSGCSLSSASEPPVHNATPWLLALLGASLLGRRARRRGALSARP